MIEYILYIVTVLVIAGIYAIFSLGLNLEWGFTGVREAGYRHNHI